MSVGFNTCQKNGLQDGLRDFDHVMLDEHDRLRLIIAVWHGCVLRECTSVQQPAQGKGSWEDEGQNRKNLSQEQVAGQDESLR